MKRIAVFGCGGFGREVVMLIQQINAKHHEWDIIGFFDDGVEKGSLINGFPVLGGLKELNDQQSETYIVIAIANSDIKEKIVNGTTNKNVKFPVLIHPSAMLGPQEFLKIGEGTIICAGCIITVNIDIGKHVILNLSCTVGHDAVIKDYCSFMPTVNISGEVLIGAKTFVGTGSKIINLVTIGENVIIGAGAVVSKEIPSNCTAVGVPAKPIKFH